MQNSAAPLVSIVIPLYNAEKYFPQCFESIIGQTYQNIEIIIIDDCGSDSSPKLADDYAKLHENVTVIHKSANEGLNRARQSGAKNASGQYIAFIDSDDLVATDYIEVLLHALLSEDAQVAVSGYRFFTDESEIITTHESIIPKTYDRKDSLYFMLTGLLYWPHKNSPLTNIANKLLAQAIVTQIDWDFCDYSFGEDDFCSALLFNLSQKNVVIDKQLYYYRKSNPDSLTKKDYSLKNNGTEISVFDLCNDYRIKVSKLLGEAYQNEVNYRAYHLFKYYAWNMLEYKNSLKPSDIEAFDNHFPLLEVRNIDNHTVDSDFVRATEERGLTGYINLRIMQQNNYIVALEKQRDTISCLLSYKDQVLDLNEGITNNPYNGYEAMYSIKNSARRFLGNVARKMNRAYTQSSFYLSRKQKQKKLDFEKVAVEQRLEKVYATQETKIPKIIHYCWFGGKPKPLSVLRCIDSWRLHLPEYEMIEWNETNFNLNLYLYVKEAYGAKKWAFVTDVARLETLKTYGGIYMDTDVEVIKPLDCFLDDRAFSSFEAGNPENGIFIPTGLMASEKNGEWVTKLLQHYDDRSFFLPNGEMDMLPNPTPITEATVEKYGLRRDNSLQNLGAVTIYPNEYFCPKSWYTQKLELTKNSFAIHHFNGSWLAG